MACFTICRSLVLIFLLVSCIVLFILHSLYFILRNVGDSQQQEIKTNSEVQLFMPALLICNLMPFSQDGINSVSGDLRQDAAIRYLREWTNPSWQEAATFVPMSSSYMQQGQNTLYQSQQTQSVGYRNLSIDRMQYQCQSIINSCSFKNVQLSSYDCCKNVFYHVPTTNGLCWLFQDKTMWQNMTSPLIQFSIVFQISRNSWYYPNSITTHPGVDIYLKENGDDVLRLATELDNPIRLMDKKGVRLKMHKQKQADTRRNECGQSMGNSINSDKDAQQGNRTNWLMCNIMVSIRYCGCHPLIAEMLPYDVNKFRDFSNRVNYTDVCTVDQYNNCSRQFIDLTRVINWGEQTPAGFPGYDDVEKCRNDNHQSCYMVTYPGNLDQYDLPPEYQNTQDYVSRLVLEYDSMRVTEILFEKNPNLYELLSYIGYNIALWFSVGHILWSLFSMGTDDCQRRKNNKVTPSPSHTKIISQPIPVGMAPIEAPLAAPPPIQSNTLPPLRSSMQESELEPKEQLVS